MRRCHRRHQPSQHARELTGKTARRRIVELVDAGGSGSSVHSHASWRHRAARRHLRRSHQRGSRGGAERQRQQSSSGSFSGGSTAAAEQHFKREEQRKGGAAAVASSHGARTRLVAPHLCSLRVQHHGLTRAGTSNMFNHGKQARSLMRNEPRGLLRTLRCEPQGMGGC